jgi:hypothetical protein
MASTENQRHKYNQQLENDDDLAQFYLFKKLE